MPYNEYNKCHDRDINLGDLLKGCKPPCHDKLKERIEIAEAYHYDRPQAPHRHAFDIEEIFRILDMLNGKIEHINECRLKEILKKLYLLERSAEEGKCHVSREELWKLLKEFYTKTEIDRKLEEIREALSYGIIEEEEIYAVADKVFD